MNLVWSDETNMTSQQERTSLRGWFPGRAVPVENHPLLGIHTVMLPAFRCHICTMLSLGKELFDLVHKYSCYLVPV